jgi:hypothetical protein
MANGQHGEPATYQLSTIGASHYADLDTAVSGTLSIEILFAEESKA